MMSQTLADNTMAVLQSLLGQAHAQPLEGLARSHRMSIAQVSQAIDQLRHSGCEIDAHPQRGVQLRRTGLGCWADFIEPRHAHGFGKRLVVYARTASTQNLARRLVLDAGTESAAGRDGWVIVADHQEAGRGRLGRQWLDQPGGQLLLTAIAACGISPAPGIAPGTDRLMHAACHALSQTVEQLTNLPVRLRWPNDLMIDGRKLAGLLVETVGGASLIGIGLNVALNPAALPPPLDQIATSLAVHGCHIDRLCLLDVLLSQLDHAMNRLTDNELHDAWRARCDMVQQRITVRHHDRTLTGRVIDIDPLHGLLLAVEHGPVVTLPAATTRLVLDNAL